MKKLFLFLLIIGMYGCCGSPKMTWYQGSKTITEQYRDLKECEYEANKNKTIKANYGSVSVYNTKDLLKQCMELRGYTLIDEKTGKTKKKQNTPEEIESLYLVGVSYYSKKDYKRALIIFNGLIESFPKSEFVDDSHFMRAETFYATKKYPEAVKEYQLVLDKFPQSSYAEKARSGLDQSQKNIED